MKSFLAQISSMVLLGIFILFNIASAEENQSAPRLIREYKGVSMQLADISADGKLILCARRYFERSFYVVLTVYDAETGKQIGKYSILENKSGYVTSRFKSNQEVMVIEKPWGNPHIENTWDFKTGSHKEETITNYKEFARQNLSNPLRLLPASCSLPIKEKMFGYSISDDGTMAAIITGSGNITDDDVLTLNYRVFLNVVDTLKCSVISNYELSFPEKDANKAPQAPQAKDNSFKDAQLSLALAKSMTISPDKTKVALSYGILAGNSNGDSIGVFGIYSMADGHRIATLKGDTFENINNLSGIRRADDGLQNALDEMDRITNSHLNPRASANNVSMLNQNEETKRMLSATQTARPTMHTPSKNPVPSAGLIKFSPDSKTFYASSNNLRQWDISNLK
jgi:hypothetical protein